MSYLDSYRTMVPFSKLEGETIKAVGRGDRGMLSLSTESGVFWFQHDQECCEHVYFDDGSSDDPEDLVGETVISADESMCSGSTNWGTQTSTFYKIRTLRRDVTLVFRGESKGYYSEDVDFHFDRYDEDEED